MIIFKIYFQTLRHAVKLFLNFIPIVAQPVFSTLFEVEEIRQQITTEVILLLTHQTKAAKTIKHQISLRHN